MLLFYIPDQQEEIDPPFRGKNNILYLSPHTIHYILIKIISKKTSSDGDLKRNRLKTDSKSTTRKRLRFFDSLLLGVIARCFL